MKTLVKGLSEFFGPGKKPRAARPEIYHYQVYTFASRHMPILETYDEVEANRVAKEHDGGEVEKVRGKI